MKVKVPVTQSSLALLPRECSPPGSSVHGILQATTLEWVAIPFSRGSSWPRDQTQVSCTTGRFFTIWVTREVQDYWDGLLFPSPGDLPNPGTKPRSSALQADSLPSESQCTRIEFTDQDTEWLNGLKNKTQLYTASRRLTPALKIDTGSKWKDGRWYSKEMAAKRTWEDGGVCMCSVAMLCLTLCNPMDCSSQGSSVHGISPARILEWIAISFSGESSWSRVQTRTSYISRQMLYHWASREARKSPEINPYIHIYIIKNLTYDKGI